MTDAIGFLSFTEVTDPAAHPAYNAWHQLDHQPEQFSVPGVRFGQRWVSTPACRRARAASGPEARRRPVRDPLPDGAALHRDARRLLGPGAGASRRRAVLRIRRSLLNGPFAVADMRAAAGVAIQPQLLPFRPSRGLYVSVERREARPAPTSWTRRRPGRSRRRLAPRRRTVGSNGTDGTSPDGRRPSATSTSTRSSRRSSRRRSKASHAGGAQADARRAVRDDHAVAVGLVQSPADAPS